VRTITPAPRARGSPPRRGAARGPRDDRAHGPPHRRRSRWPL